MKYYIIAGEASGDLHASNLIREIRSEDPGATFRCWGGDLMEEQGGVVVRHFKDLAFMGFWEVLTNLRTIMNNFKFCEKDILAYNPDVVILVDYPGFNLRVAEFASKHNLKVFYYISPQLWAWRSSRVKKIRKYVDKMFVILPFEKEFYHKHGYEVEFVGHPLLDVILRDKEAGSKPGFLAANGLPAKPVIALLPGSRRQEIRIMLEIMLKVIPEFPAYQFVIAGAPSVPDSFYKEITRRPGCGDRNRADPRTPQELAGSPCHLGDSHAGNSAPRRSGGGMLQGKCRFIPDREADRPCGIHFARQPDHGQGGGEGADPGRPDPGKPCIGA